jgi:hypothetical protein
MKAKGIAGRTWDVGEDKAKIDALRNKIDQTVSEFTVRLATCKIGRFLTFFQYQVVSSIRSLTEVENNKVQVKDVQRAIEELKSELEQYKYLDAAEQGMH